MPPNKLNALHAFLITLGKLLEPESINRVIIGDQCQYRIRSESTLGKIYEHHWRNMRLGI